MRSSAKWTFGITMPRWRARSRKSRAREPEPAPRELREPSQRTCPTSGPRQSPARPLRSQREPPRRLRVEAHGAEKTRRSSEIEELLVRGGRKGAPRGVGAQVLTHKMIEARAVRSEGVGIGPAPRAHRDEFDQVIAPSRAEVDPAWID